MKFALLLSLLAGVAVYNMAPASAGPALVTKDGVTVPLREAGAVEWRGKDMPGATMVIMCGKNGIVVGLAAEHAVALNGYTAGFRHDGKVTLRPGASLPIVTADKRDLVSAGMVAASADPLGYDPHLSDGLALGRKACATG